MQTAQYKIKVIKETIVTLDSDTEAEQVAELLANRELGQQAFGNPLFVYSDFEKVLS
jgi:hypothetical protein